MGSSGAAQNILFVVDASGQQRNAQLIGQCGGRCVSIRDVSRDKIKDAQVVAVDVDLTLGSNVKPLRDALAGRRKNCFKIFSVDLGRRLETIHAGIAGASELVRRPFNRHELDARIAAFFRANTLSAADVALAESSIAAAAAAIGNMFEALTSGKAVEMPAVISAGTDIVDAIGAVGLPSWVDTVRRHHEGTFQHCLIVTGLASSFGRATGMSRRDILTLTVAGLLHDIGKAAVPVAILDKPGKLSSFEIDLIKTHPALGYDHLRGNADLSADTLAAVRGHHEYLDGSGYPDGLCGKAIGDVTRILTICDVFGAMIERRAYKPPKPTNEAIAVLEEMAEAGKLEGALVKAFYAAAA